MSFDPNQYKDVNNFHLCRKANEYYLISNRIGVSGEMIVIPFESESHQPDFKDSFQVTHGVYKATFIPVFGGRVKKPIKNKFPTRRVRGSAYSFVKRF